MSQNSCKLEVSKVAYISTEQPIKKHHQWVASVLAGQQVHLSPALKKRTQVFRVLGNGTQEFYAMLFSKATIDLKVFKGSVQSKTNKQSSIGTQEEEVEANRRSIFESSFGKEKEYTLFMIASAPSVMVLYTPT